MEDSILDEETLTRVAQSARLKLSEENAQKLHCDMESILTSFKELQSLKTQDKELFYPNNVNNVLRNDNNPQPFFEKEKILSQVPKREEENIIVPKSL